MSKRKNRRFTPPESQAVSRLTDSARFRRDSDDHEINRLPWRSVIWSLTPKAFAEFLSWLAPDWEEAGWKYEQIRTKMLGFFARRGCHNPEELFDRTIDRICGKIEVEAIESLRDVLAFCYAVGRFVALEYWREMKLAPLPEDPKFLEIEDPEQNERKFEWLERRLCIDGNRGNVGIGRHYTRTSALRIPHQPSKRLFL